MTENAYHVRIGHDSYGPPTAGGTGPGDTLIKLVAASVLQRAGEPFFDSLLRLLSARFDVAYGIIGIADRKWQAIETIVAFENGNRVGNFSYTLRGTPCETVFSPQQICIYPRSVVDMFPADVMLGEIDAAGYVGMPLFDREGDLLGLMALVTKSQIPEPDAVAEMLKVFGRRASLELEHLLAIRAAADGVALVEQRAATAELSLAEFVERLRRP